MDVEFGYVIPVSQELLNDAIDFRTAMDRWRTATPEQREQWQREAEEGREAERAAAEQTALSVESICAKFGWTYAYALHFVQPYCGCGPHVDDGWYYCQHARDLGLDET